MTKEQLVEKLTKVVESPTVEVTLKGGGSDCEGLSLRNEYVVLVLRDDLKKVLELLKG